VQRRPRQDRLLGPRGARIEIPPQERSGLAVEGIDGEGMSERRQMDPDLVGTTRARTAGAGREPPESLERRHVGARLLPLSRRCDPHRTSASRNEGFLASALRGDVASHQREVDLFGAARFERGIQRAMGVGAERENDHSARSAIEPVHGQRSRCDVPHLARERRLRFAPAPRHRRNARRLVDGQDQIVPVQDAEHPATVAPAAQPVQTLPCPPADGRLPSLRPAVAWRGKGTGPLSNGKRRGGENVAFDILDLVWRDFDRMARAGATPLQLLADPASWVIAGHRVGRALQALPSLLRAPLQLAYRPWELALGAFAGLTLPVHAEIGGGLRLYGTGGILVSPKAHIGRDCDLSRGAVIAETETGAPWIGDRVHIGAGARILGGVRIGNGARIGASAVVDRDVPDGGIVAGVLEVVETIRGRRRPPILDPIRRALRSFLPRPTQLFLRAG